MDEQPTLSDLDLRGTLALIRSVQQTAYLIPLTDAEAVLGELSRTQGLMPLTNPTEYNQLAGKLNGNADLVRAFIDYRRALEKIGANIEAGGYT